MAIYFAVMITPSLHSSTFVYTSNAVLVALSLAGILSEPDRAYSARKFVYFFIFFFMGLASLMQFKTGAQTVGGYIIHEGTYTQVNCIMIGVIVLFELSYRYFYKHIRQPFMHPSVPPGEVEPHRRKQWRTVLLCISVAASIITIAYYHNEWVRLISRGVSGAEFDIHRERTLDVYINLGLRWFIRPLTALCCINYLVMGHSRKYKIVFLSLMLVAFFPTSLERLRAAVFYMALLIILFPALKFKNRFSLLFLGGILIVFPFLNNFRIWKSAGWSWPKFDLSMFCAPDYDSYQSFAFALQNKFIDFSGQVFELFFFWVPRAWWPEKPMPSGFKMAHIYDLDYDFITMNFWGEGYVFCGFIGIFLFTVALAWLIAKMDRNYWQVFGGSTRNLFAPFYCLFLGLVFFILRGDLIGAIVESGTILGLNYLIYRISLYFLKSNRA